MKKIIIYLFILQFVMFNSSKILSDEQYNGDILYVYVNGLVCDFCARSIEKIFSKKVIGFTRIMTITGHLLPAT